MTMPLTHFAALTLLLVGLSCSQETCDDGICGETVEVDSRGSAMLQVKSKDSSVPAVAEDVIAKHSDSSHSTQALSLSLEEEEEDDEEGGEGGDIPETIVDPSLWEKKDGDLPWDNGTLGRADDHPWGPGHTTWKGGALTAPVITADSGIYGMEFTVTKPAQIFLGLATTSDIADIAKVFPKIEQRMYITTYHKQRLFIVPGQGAAQAHSHPTEWHSALNIWKNGDKLAVRLDASRTKTEYVVNGDVVKTSSEAPTFPLRFAASAGTGSLGNFNWVGSSGEAVITVFMPKKTRRKGITVLVKGEKGWKLTKENFGGKKIRRKGLPYRTSKEFDKRNNKLCREAPLKECFKMPWNEEKEGVDQGDWVQFAISKEAYEQFKTR